MSKELNIYSDNSGFVITPKVDFVDTECFYKGHGFELASVFLYDTYNIQMYFVKVK